VLGVLFALPFLGLRELTKGNFWQGQRNLSGSLDRPLLQPFRTSNSIHMIPILRCQGQTKLSYYSKASKRNCVPPPSSLIEKGANLHLAGYGHAVLPHPNNHCHTTTSEHQHKITSRRMMTSARFVKWREQLLQAGIDLPSFSTSAAIDKPLIAAGWDEHALMRAFNLDTSTFKPKTVPQYHSYCDCGCDSGVAVGISRN